MLFCGFNGFGQFGSNNDRKVNKLTAFNNENHGFRTVAAARAYNAFAKDDLLFLFGFLELKTNHFLEIKAPDVIVQIAANEKFCLILLRNGKVLKVDANSTAINLIEIKFAVVSEEKVTRKRSIFGELCSSNSNTEIKVLFIACGSNIAVAITKCNAVYNIPSKIFQLPKHIQIVSVECGFEHALALNSNGDVYTWGNGLRGQLGSGMLRIDEEPKIIEALTGIKIIYIAAGGWHSAAVSVFGDVYTWGFNVNGQLGLRVYKDSHGLKNATLYPLPQLIDLFNCCSLENNQDFDCNVQKVFAGARHTVLQMSCGSLLVAGWNKYGQLGLSNVTKQVDKFQKLSMKMNLEDLEIRCGPWCTIIARS